MTTDVARDLEPDTEPARSAIPLALRQLLPGALVLFTALRVLQPVSDPDTFWHVRAGQLLARDWQFVLTDPWGAAATRPWVLHQWLPQLLMGWVEGWAGPAGVAWLVSLAAAATVLAVWWSCRARSSILVSVLVTALALLAMAQSISPRPQMVSFVLTAITVGAWLRTHGDGRARWWLVPLTYAWACSHGMWLLGPLVGVVVVAGIALDRAAPPRQVGRLALVPLLSVVAAAFTPVGPRLLLAPVQVGSVTRYIDEWQPASPTSANLLAALALAAIPLLAGLRSRQRTPWTSVLLVGLALALALTAERTVPFAAVILAPLAAQAAASLVPREPVERREVVATAVATGLALVLAAGLAVSTATRVVAAPTDLDAALGELPAGTVLCNEWGDGGWIIWAHPQLAVTMDTRVETYTVEHVESYIRFVSASPGWAEYPAALGCTYALLPSDAPVVEALGGRGWTTTAQGVERVLLRAP